MPVHPQFSFLSFSGNSYKNEKFQYIIDNIFASCQGQICIPWLILLCCIL